MKSFGKKLLKALLYILFAALLLVLILFGRILYNDSLNQREKETKVIEQGIVAETLSYSIASRESYGLYTTQGLFRGELIVQKKSLNYNDGNFELEILDEKLYSDVIAKEEVIFASEAHDFPVVFAKEVVKVLPYLNGSTNFKGLELHVNEVPLELNGFLLDYDLSQDGKVLNIAVATLLGSIKPSAAVCGNCVQITFEVKALKYDLETQEFVDVKAFDEALLLVDRPWGVAVENVDMIDLANDNVEMVNYESLVSNDLIHYRIISNDFGSRSVMQNLGLYYAGNDGAITNPYSYEALGFNLSNATHPAIKYFWATENDLWFKPAVSSDFLLGVNLKSDTKLSMKGSYPISVYEWSDSEQLVLVHSQMEQLCYFDLRETGYYENLTEQGVADFIRFDCGERPYYVVNRFKDSIVVLSEGLDFKVYDFAQEKFLN